MRPYLTFFKTVASVKEVVEVKEKKTTRNWTVEETNLFCSILTDPVTKFMQTLEQKTLKKQKHFPLVLSH